MTRRHSLCMVVHGRYPLDSRVAREALAAVEAGWSVDVIAMRGPSERARETIDGVSVFRLPLSHNGAAGALSAAGEYLGFTMLASAHVAARAARRRYAVIHVHSPPDFLILAALVPRAIGTRVILDIHDFAPELFATRFRGSHARRAEWLLRQVERAATRFAGAVVTVHEPYRRALELRGVPSEKITVLINSLDERLLPPLPPSVEDGFRVVYHGTVTPHYGVDLLVKAAAIVAQDVPDLKLEIYGDGDALPDVRRLANQLRLSEKVSFSGRFLPQRDVLARVRSAAVGVICNRPIARNETAVPTKLFEYACVGVPVVSADLAAIREYFGSGEVRFFKAGSVDELAAALRDVASAPDAAEKRARAARRRYEAYRWATSAQRYVALIERLSAS